MKPKTIMITKPWGFKPPSQYGKLLNQSTARSMSQLAIKVLHKVSQSLLELWTLHGNPNEGLNHRGELVESRIRKRLSTERKTQGWVHSRFLQAQGFHGLRAKSGDLSCCERSIGNSMHCFGPKTGDQGSQLLREKRHG